MPLKLTVDNLDNVPEGLREHYTETDGAFTLAVEGVKPLEDFNRVYGSLEKERGEHKATLEKLKAFGGKTPADLLKLETRILELEAAGGGELDETQIEKIVKQRLVPFEHQKTQAEAQIAELTAELDQMKTAALGVKRKEAVLQAIGDKVNPEFHKDLIYRAERELSFNSDLNDFTDQIGSTVADWAARQLRETPSWVVKSNGAGAKGGQGAPASSENPFLPGKSFNLTKQGELLRSDPKRAAQLKAQAASAN